MIRTMAETKLRKGLRARLVVLPWLKAGGRYHPHLVLGSKAELLRHLGDLDAAGDIYQENVRWAARAGDQQALSSAQLDMGHLAGQRNHYRKALWHLLRALAHARRSGDGRREGNALSYLGGVYWRTGNYRRALVCHRAALQLARQGGDRRAEAVATANAALIEGEQGRHRESLEQLGTALAIFREIGDLRGIAQISGNIGTAHQNLGEYSQAIEHYQAKLELSHRIGEKTGVLYALGALALAKADLGLVDEAKELYARTMDISRECQDERSLAIALGNKAFLHKTIGEIKEATELYRQAISVGEPLGVRFYLQDFYCHLSEILLDSGDAAGAAVLADKAQDICRELGLSADLSRSRILRCRIAHALASKEAERKAAIDECLAPGLVDPGDENGQAMRRAALYRMLSDTDPESAEVHRAMALDIYRRLHMASPKLEYMNAIRSLSAGGPEKADGAWGGQDG